MGKMDETEKARKEAMLARSTILSRERKRIMRLEVQNIDFKDDIARIHRRLQAIERAIDPDGRRLHDIPV